MNETEKCSICDDRGFVFLEVDNHHRKQVLCPKCQGAPIRAKALALILSGEKVDIPNPDGDSEERYLASAVFRQLPYDQQMMITLRKQLKE